MSRLGKQLINVPSEVKIEKTDGKVSAKGPLGELSLTLQKGFDIEIDGNQARVVPPDDSRDSMRLLGLSRSLVANMIEGVAKGFKKVLVLEGVGFKAVVQGQKLTLTVGYSTPVEYTIREGVNVEVNGNEISVSGTDKQKVGDVAAIIRGFYPAEPYKGKGLKYKGELIRRKVGKTVA